MLTTVSAILAAVFSGILAFKAFGNKKPVTFYRHQPDDDGIDDFYIVNPNIEHYILIYKIVNESDNANLSVRVADNEENLKPPIAFDGSYFIGKLIHSRETWFLAVCHDNPDTAKPMHLMVERDNFNYFSSVPAFNVVIKPFGFRTRFERIGSAIRPWWQKRICRYGPLRQ